MRRRIAARVASWARKRQGMDALPVVLAARRLYILPTRAGVGFALLLLVMLVAGLNYTNSLALILTFMLTGFVLVGMHECQRTLRGMEIAQVQVSECHAGGAGRVTLRCINAASVARRALALACADELATHFELESRSEATVSAAFHPQRRGIYRLSRLKLTTTAPFGLFRAWTWLHLPLEAIVYPRAVGSLPLPLAGDGVASRSQRPTIGDEEWAALRSYQPGDNPRSIAWKAWARGERLMVAQYESEGGSDIVLSFVGLEALDLEAKLSQLSRWILDSDRLGHAYALQLPGAHWPLGRGAEHRATVLHALAAYGAPTP